MKKEDVLRLAELARLSLSDSELETRAKELERILEYVNRLAKVDTTGVSETSSISNHEPRTDAAFSCDEATREIILSNFPDRLGDALRVPAVFEKPKG